MLLQLKISDITAFIFKCRDEGCLRKKVLCFEHFVNDFFPIIVTRYENPSEVLEVCRNQFLLCFGRKFLSP